jgi:hypothetical protein
LPRSLELKEFVEETARKKAEQVESQIINEKVSEIS